MKTKALILLCIFGLNYALSAHRIVNVSRSNGLFGYYSDVRQTFNGYYSNGDESWTLVCENPGFSRCRLHYVALTPRKTEIGNIENSLLDNLMLEIENDEINNNNTTGQKTKHYQSTLSDNSVIDIYMTVSWEPDPNNSGYSLFHATISNSEE